jgi:hypothetical protein
MDRKTTLQVSGRCRKTRKSMNGQTNLAAKPCKNDLTGAQRII